MFIDELRIEQLDSKFSTSLPKPEDAERCRAINEAAKAFAKAVIQNAPWSLDRDHALQVIREAAVWARHALLAGESRVSFGEEITTESGNRIRLLE